jgi:nucleoside-diphosphate-sugar epimerase
MRVLVTGSKGMIGSHLVKGLLDAGYEVVGLDRSSDTSCGGKYFHHIVDLADKDTIQIIVENFNPDRIIHLAALAHAADGKEFTWEDYKHLNVDCAKNIFDVAGDIPVLFISTVDVFGFTKGIVSAKTPMKPVSNYGRSKMMAEQEVRKKKYFDIFRFSPVYTDTIKRDIQKRYYLKYPSIAYQIGKGTEYEILNVDVAVKAMVDWCSEEPKNTVRIIKDEKRMWTPDYIKAEKAAGRAKLVVRIPKCVVNCGYAVLKGITGENKYTYLLNKAVHPIQSENL